MRSVTDSWDIFPCARMHAHFGEITVFLIVHNTLVLITAKTKNYMDFKKDLHR